VEPQVLRVHDDTASPPETQGGAKLGETGQGAHQGDHAVRAWALGGEGDRGDDPVPSRLGDLFPAVPSEERLRGAGPMDTQEAARESVATVETAMDQSQEDDPARDRKGKGLDLGDEWTRPVVERRSVAYERCGARQVVRTAGAHEPSGGTSTPCESCMNRRMPNGTYGGVGGWGP